MKPPFEGNKAFRWSLCIIELIIWLLFEELIQLKNFVANYVPCYNGYSVLFNGLLIKLC